MREVLEVKNLVEKARALWDNEQIRILVMASLGMQILLIIFVPFRKRSGNKMLFFLLWVVYLGADYIATLALGTIFLHTMDSSLGVDQLGAGIDSNERNLIAFWACFPLLHLGGPDNITSYSIEDNELWWRRSINFAFSVGLVVLVLSMLQNTTQLVPTVLTFVVGITKFGERILALRAATMQQIRISTQKNRFDNSEIDSLGRFLPENKDVEESVSIFRGYMSFLLLRSHMVSLIDKREWLWPEDNRVFEEIGMELSFFFDILHTKATVVHSFWGRVVRLASLISILLALSFFHISEKYGHDSIDVLITYILLLMALFQEIHSDVLLVSSNWTTISLFLHRKRWCTNLAEFILRAKKRVLCRGEKRWWSGHMGQYSLIQSCVRKMDGRHTLLNAFKNAWDFLFGDKQSAAVSDALEKMMIEHVSSLVAPIRNHEFHDYRDYRDLSRKLRSSWMSNTLDRYYWDLKETKNLMMVKSFDECVIAWHIATEICYFVSNDIDDDDDNRDIEERRMREATYRVSNYMMHLLLEQESMMPPGIANLRMEDTWRDICGAFSTDASRGIVSAGNTRQVFKCLLGLPSEKWQHWLDIARASQTTGLYPESVCPLFSMLWMEIRKLGESSEGRLWEVIRSAWMEMLTFAALRCSPTEHAKTLSRGGELLTHYWLLLAHYYIYEEFNYPEERLVTEV